MRVAVVGAGPKGLYAVEELLARAPRAVVDVWDSRPPGTGAAYATDQPVWLRLNVTSAIVDGFDGVAVHLMTTRNSAVMEKSMPVVSKGSTLPSSAPATQPTTQ